MELYDRLYAAIREHSGMDRDEIRQAGEHGADAGWAGFTYTTDCVDFYNANRDDIWELAREMADSIGGRDYTVPALVASFNSADMADTADGFANLLAWFTLEEVGRWLEDDDNGRCDFCNDERWVVVDEHDEMAYWPASNDPDRSHWTPCPTCNADGKVGAYGD